MVTCQRSTEWIVRKEQEKLSFRQQLQLISHLAICKACRLFEQQNALINKALNESRNHELHALTVAEKEALVSHIQQRFL